MLAIVDTHFPWLLSGFRYWENYQFYNIDKEVLFFSLNKMNDYFPTEVHPLEHITQYPITDIYCVFLNHTLGLLDYPKEIPGKQNYGLSKLIQERNISIHATIYPGGGYEENFLDQAEEGLRFLGSHPNVKNVFTNVDDVKRIVPRAHRVAGVPVNTDFYEYAQRQQSDKIHLLFAAFNRREKGFKYFVKAFNRLAPSKHHIHIVGDWAKELYAIRNSNFTYYGPLLAADLRKVYYKCHIFINPTYRGSSAFWNRHIHKRYITLDGFPTAAARDAMSTGCCLISTNSRHDHTVFVPAEDYLEIREKSPEDIIKALEYLYCNKDEILAMAQKGSGKIKKNLDYRKIVAFKYNIITNKDEGSAPFSSTSDAVDM